MSGYVKLFSDIVESSIWQEPPEVCKVWITLLAMADSEGFVRGSDGWLSLRAKVGVEACRIALQKFAAPDPLSRTTTQEGRRIEVTPDGWVILNYTYYREQNGRELSKDPRRAYQREWMRQKRSQQACQQESTDTDSRKPSASASVLNPKGKEVKKEGGEIPECLLSVRGFSRAWEAFLESRMSLRKKNTPEAKRLLLMTFAQHPERAVEGIKRAIVQGWVGFEWEWLDKKVPPARKQRSLAELEAGAS